MTTIAGITKPRATPSWFPNTPTDVAVLICNRKLCKLRIVDLKLITLLLERVEIICKKFNSAFYDQKDECIIYIIILDILISLKNFFL